MAERTGPAPSEGQDFTLRSEFSRRALNAHRQSTPSQADGTQHDVMETEIAESLRVIDSARRFLASSGQTSAFKEMKAMEASVKKPALARDQSKETLKHHQSIGSTVENANDMTQELFKDDLCTSNGDIGQTSMTLGQAAQHDGHLNSFECREVSTLIQKLTPAREAGHRASVDERAETMPSPRHERIRSYQFSCKEEPHVGDVHQSVHLHNPHNETFLRVEHVQKAPHNQSTSIERSTAPLRLLAPIMPSEDQPGFNMPIPAHDSQLMPQTTKVRVPPNQVQFLSDPVSVANTHRSVSDKRGSMDTEQAYKPGDAMSPAALKREYDRFNRRECIEEVECSQMYETGDHSSLVKSLSKANQSAKSSEHVVALIQRTNFNSDLPLQESSKESGSAKPSPDQKSNASRSHADGQEILAAQHSVANISLSGSKDLCTEGDEPAESTDYQPTVLQKVKNKIVISYDKLELERKLAAMTKSINNFKTAYDCISSQNNETEPSARQSQATMANTRAEASGPQESPLRSGRSASPPKQIKPKAGKPQALKILKKPYTAVKEPTLTVTVDSSRDEQTFRPQYLRDENEYPPLQREGDAASTSHAALSSAAKDRSSQKTDRLDREYREVVKQTEHEVALTAVDDFEARQRSEVKMAHFGEASAAAKRHTRFAQEPLSEVKSHGLGRSNSQMSGNPTQDEEDLPPQPQQLPRLLTHESGQLDGRYFTCTSPTGDSHALLSGRSVRFDNNGNPVSCLRNCKSRASNTSRGDPCNTFFSPKAGQGIQPYAQAAKGETRMLRRPNSYTMDSGAKEELLSDGQVNVTKTNFNDILSPSSQSRSLHQLQDSQDNLQKLRGVEQPSVQQFEHRIQLAKQYQKRMRKIDFFDDIKPGVGARHGPAQTTLSTERSKVANNTQSGTFHNTQRSMGIESFCQRKERAIPPPGPVAMTPAEKTDALHQQLALSRRTRQEMEEAKTELVALRGENYQLKQQVEQKDLALAGLWEKTETQEKELEELRARVAFCENELETANDPMLFRKYKELVVQREDLANQVASRDFAIQGKTQSHELMQAQYENMKTSQLELVEMNKKLITSYQGETNSLQDQLAAAQTELDRKQKKLNKFTEIIKSFNSQIELFEQFQTNSNGEIHKLEERLALFQDLYKKEKEEKEHLIRRMRPSLRPPHDSVRRMNALQQMSQQTGGVDWERANESTIDVYAFEAEEPVEFGETTPEESPTPAQQTSGKSTQRVTEPTGGHGDRQVKMMQKNMSFGQPFMSERLTPGGMTTSNDPQYTESHEYTSEAVIDTYHRFQGPGPVYDSQRRTTSRLSGHHHPRHQPHVLAEYADYPVIVQTRTGPTGPSITDDDDELEEKVRSPGDYGGSHLHQLQQKCQDEPYPEYEGRLLVQDTSSLGRQVTYEQDRSLMEVQGEGGQEFAYQTPVEGILRSSRYRTKSSEHHAASEAPNSRPKSSHLNQDLHISRAEDTLDISNYSVSHSMQRIRHKEHEQQQAAKSKKLANCQSAIIRKRGLSFKKPQGNSSQTRRPASSQSLHKAHTTLVTGTPKGANHQFKVQPMGSQEYYCRLREMQRRLDKARNELHKNVSRSRSRSPVDQLAGVGPVAALSVDPEATSHTLAIPMTANTSYTQDAPVARRETPSSVSKSGLVVKPRKAKGLSSKKAPPHANQPLFYTSLYNGVKPVDKNLQLN